jgi:hypothetical protein
MIHISEDIQPISKYQRDKPLDFQRDSKKKLALLFYVQVLPFMLPSRDSVNLIKLVLLSELGDLDT